MSREEYAFFKHPEESRDVKLQELAVDEVIDDMDQDGDRYILKLVNSRLYALYVLHYLTHYNNFQGTVFHGRKFCIRKLLASKSSM